MTAEGHAGPRVRLDRYDGTRTDHRCAAGRSCRDPVIDDQDTRTPAVIAEPAGLCRRCTLAVGSALCDLGSDYRQLGAALSQHRARGDTDFVSGTPEPPISLNTAAEALARSMAEWAEAAVSMVSGALGIDPLPSRGRGYPRYKLDAAAIKAAAAIVGPNLDLLLAAPVEPVVVWNRDGSGRYIIDADGIDVALRLLRCHRQMNAVLGDPNPRQRLSMPCPVLDCGMPTLGQSNGSTDVTCTSCGGRWTDREYQWLAGLLVEDIRNEERKRTVEEIVGGLTPGGAG